MSDSGPVADARLAFRLLALAPQGFGGITLRGIGPVREMLLEELMLLLPPGTPWRWLPHSVDDVRLLGGLDIAASLVSGRPVNQRGLIAEAKGGYLLLPMAERMDDKLSGRLAQAVDEAGGDLSLILLDDGIAEEERPPATLTERLAFAVDLTPEIRLPLCHPAALPVGKVARASIAERQLEALSQTSLALGIDSARALTAAHRAAVLIAGLAGRAAVADSDLACAARLVFAHRATRLPQKDAEKDMQPPEPTGSEGGTHEGNTDGDTRSLEDTLVEAVVASLPGDLLADLAQGRTTRGARGGGSGKRGLSRLRGRPLGARPGTPGASARLALVDTMRAAVPWQELRRRQTETHGTGLWLRKEDLRIRRFEERTGSTTIFCVDASGSAAIARLAEAKGAVERLLAQAYVKRSEVALVAFRGTGAELLLPPTRSLTRARRALAELPGGGGTPLATGIGTALHVADAVAARGRTPFIAFLTDGSANIDADGAPGRAKAREDALANARLMARRGYAALVIDISPRPRPEARDLAEAMRARYLPLPIADSATLERAVATAQSAQIAA